MTVFASEIVTPGVPVNIRTILQTGRQYIIDVAAGESDLGELEDPYLFVLDEEGNKVLENDDIDFFLDVLSSQVIFTPTETQEYTFRVEGVGSSTGTFELKVEVDDYANGIVAIAPRGALATSDTDPGRINYIGDLDVFETNLIEGLTYRLEMRGVDTESGTLDDPFLELLDSDGLFLDGDDNGGEGFDAAIDYTAMRTGTYYLSASDADEERGTYRILAGQGRGTDEGETVDGTSFADSINALGGEDRVDGDEGNDRIRGGDGGDRLRGGEGRDRLLGESGQDQLRGESGRDTLIGGASVDVLVGGTQGDIFDFNRASESRPGQSDILRSGGGARAFEGAGAGSGDRIDVRSIDANAERSGNQAFRFGTSEEIGRIWAENSGNDTIIFGNVDDDARAEFRLRIEDGLVLADAYASGDFVL